MNLKPIGFSRAIEWWALIEVTSGKDIFWKVKGYKWKELREGWVTAGGFVRRKNQVEISILRFFSFVWPSAMSSAFIVLEKKKKGNEGGGGSDEQNKMEGLPCKCRHWLPLHFGGRSESLCSHCNPFVTESGLCQVCVPFHLPPPLSKS